MAKRTSAARTEHSYVLLLIYFVRLLSTQNDVESRDNILLYSTLRRSPVSTVSLITSRISINFFFFLRIY